MNREGKVGVRIPAVPRRRAGEEGARVQQHADEEAVQAMMDDFAEFDDFEFEQQQEEERTVEQPPRSSSRRRSSCRSRTTGRRRRTSSRRPTKGASAAPSKPTRSWP
jgi:hypothetical protein